MKKEYNPKRKEILSEVWKGFRDESIQKNVSKLGKSLKQNVSKLKKPFKEFNHLALGISAFLSIGPYMIPSTTRVLIETPSSQWSLSRSENFGGDVGIVGGVLINICQYSFYANTIEKGHPEFLLIPATTNIVSGVYEIGRRIYNNAKKRVIGNHEAKTLETKL